MSTTKTWPDGSTGAVAASYTIPAVGELNWGSSLTDFLVALAEGAQCTTFQKYAVRKAVSTPVTISGVDCVVVSDLTVAGAVAVSLPAGAEKQVFYIVDGKGDATTNNITITPDGSETIAGGATFVLSSNDEGVALVYNSSDTDWKVLGRWNQAGSSVGGFTADKVIVSDGSGNLSAATTSTTQVQYLTSATGTTGTASTNVVFSTSPVLTTPNIGTPSAGVLTNCTGLVLTSGVTGVLPVANGGTNSSTALNNNRVMVSSGGAAVEATAITASRALVSDANGIPVAATTTTTQINYISSATGTTGTTNTNIVFSTSPTLVTPAIGTPSSGVLTNCTGLPMTTGVTGTLPVANGGTGVTISTGTTSVVLSSSPTIATPTFTGQAIFASGTVGDPSIGFTGDTNSGIYKPGADQVAISVNGKRAFVVDEAIDGSTLGIAVGATPGAINDNYPLMVHQSVDTTTGIDLFNTNGTSSAAAQIRSVVDIGSGNVSMTITNDGTNYTVRNTSAGVFLSAGATSWSAVSDEREKTFIGDISSGLDILRNARTKFFRYDKKDKNGISDDKSKRRIGLVAQDYVKSLPEIVSRDAEGVLSLRYTELIPVLVRAIQELDKENENMKIKISSMLK